MKRLVKVPLLLLAFVPVLIQVAEGVVSVPELETEFGPLQGQMEMRGQTVLMFSEAKVKVQHQTGEASIERIDSSASFFPAPTQPSLPDLRALKRTINRLPAHEQVRYCKLHQVRYPESEVAAELNAALDLMETVRMDLLKVQEQELNRAETEHRSYNRNRSGSSYYPSYGFSSNRRFRRSRHIDTQIELDRGQRERRPVVNLTTPMSIADQARSDAWEKYLRLELRRSERFLEQDLVFSETSGKSSTRAATLCQGVDIGSLV